MTCSTLSALRFLKCHVLPSIPKFLPHFEQTQRYFGVGKATKFTSYKHYRILRVKYLFKRHKPKLLRASIYSIN